MSANRLDVIPDAARGYAVSWHFLNLHALFIITVLISLLALLPFVLAKDGVHWDDAYIFFRYAENLRDGHGLSFNPGEIGVGVTSILWTLILVPFAHADIALASKLLGAALMALGAGIWAAMIADATGRRWLGLLAGLASVVNPVAVLFAVSGMDTALSLFLLAACCAWYHRTGLARPGVLGLLLGALFLARPDGLILAFVIGGLAAADLLRGIAARPRWPAVRNRLAGAVRLALGFGVPALPWIAFVYRETGDLVPTTRIGKLIQRLPDEHGLTFPEFHALDPIGRIELALTNLVALFDLDRGGIAMLPVVLPALAAPALWRLGRKGVGPASAGRGRLAVLLWLYVVAVLAVFSWTFPLPLPRYVAAVLPAGIACVALSLPGGALAWLERRARGGFVPSAALGIVLAAGCVAPLVVAYRLYLPHMDQQQVRREVGLWLARNTPADAVVALEPIGEIGYFAKRRIADLGGLVSPDVWPFAERGYDDPERMLAFLRLKGASYLVDRPAVLPWSLDETVSSHPELFRLQAVFGKGASLHLIYRVDRGERR